MVWRLLLGFAAAVAVLIVAKALEQPPIHIAYRNISDWPGGFVGELTIRNTGEKEISDWMVSFDLPRKITTIWGAKILSLKGSRYTARAEPWNRRIAPGGEALIGFLGTPGGALPRRLGFRAQDSPGFIPAPPDVVPGLPRVQSQQAPSQSSPVRMSFAVTEDWGTGLNAEVVLRNSSWKTQRNWTVFLDFPRAIAAIEGAELTARAGTKFRIDAPASGINAAIPPLGTIRFSLLVRPGHLVEPPKTMMFRGRSHPGTGGRFNYAEALQKSLYFYEAQRSGALPDSARVSWRGGSALQDGSDAGVDLAGGYYDAGDHIKFAFPMCGALTMLAWGGIEYREGYEAAGQWQTLLDTVRWGTDWLIKAHTGPDELFVQVGEGQPDHDFWGPAEEMTMLRRSFKIDAGRPGSDAAGEAAAALASASILFRKDDPAYAETLLVHARQLHDFADLHRGKYTDSVPEARDFYDSHSGYEDELVWAAAWLFCATGEPGYLIKAESGYAEWLNGSLGEGTHTWDDKRYGAAVLLAQLTRRETYKRDVETFLDFWTVGGSGKRIATTLGGLAWFGEWGSLRYAANTALLAFIYSDTVADYGNIYHAFAKRQLNYILGDNPARRSYMVGFGNNPPRNPHHRGSHGATDNSIDFPSENKNILYGAMVGGPVRADDFAYTDDRRDLRSNEVSLDYNAALTGGLARMVMLYGGRRLENFPPEETAENAPPAPPQP